MIQKGVAAGIASAIRTQPTAPSSRTNAEIGSPEFAEDRTQINSLNNKFIFASEIVGWNNEYTALRKHADELSHRSLKSIDELLSLQMKVNGKFFDGVDDRARIRDGWDYVKSYDLSNPNTLGTSDNVRGGVIPQNRAIDTATAQSALNNTTVQTLIQTAVAGAVADAMNGTIPTLEAAIGAAVAAALVNTPAKPAA